MKHTAVEWLEQELNEKGKLTPVDFYQAKAMEKEHIIKAYEATKFGIFAMTDTGILDTANKSGEQYYNETFKSE